MQKDHEICPPAQGEGPLAGEIDLPAATCGRPPSSSRMGFTLLELLMVMVLLGVLSSMANPRLQRALERARVARAIGDLNAIEAELLTYEAGEGRYPPTLAGIGRSTLLDPWGNPYQYNPIWGYSASGVRTDRFGVQANTDFDIYSLGPDGNSDASFTSGAGRDDVVRADDGGYMGPASEF